MITMQALKKFGLFSDPFIGDIQKADDVYLSSDTRFIAEYLYQSAKSGGLIALIGESGSGKSTIRRYAIERMKNEGQNVRVIFPQCIDKKLLTASTIYNAIIADCSAETPKQNFETRARQVKRILTNSSRAGVNHILMIEEAHDLSISTLKYLKRFWELEDGFKKLLSIVLIGQVEMKPKLNESQNWEAREVIRRMEVLELSAMTTGTEIRDYLASKFSRLDKKREDIISDDGCDALATKLCRQTAKGIVVSSAYPLTINNWCKAGMNAAAEFGADLVDADIIHSL